MFKAELAGKRNDIEDSCLVRLKQSLPEGTKVTILADRGFGDVKLFGFLGELCFDYVIRFRGDTYVTAANGETRRAKDWVGVGGRAKKLADAEISREKQRVGAVVCVRATVRRRRAPSSTYTLVAGASSLGIEIRRTFASAWA